MRDKAREESIAQTVRNIVTASLPQLIETSVLIEKLTLWAQLLDAGRADEIEKLKAEHEAARRQQIDTTSALLSDRTRKIRELRYLVAREQGVVDALAMLTLRTAGRGAMTATTDRDNDDR